MKNVTLRTRLIAALMVLVAGGLLALAAITYVSQSHYENRRVDEQTATAERAVDHALDEKLGLRGPSSDGANGFANNADLPAGTYGQRRAADGRTVRGNVLISYGRPAPPGPRLPSVLRPGQLITVDAIRGDTRYRVRATRIPDALIVVAIPLTATDKALQRLLLQEAIVIAVVLGLLAALTTALVRHEFRPLVRIADTADAIAAGDLGRRVDVAGPRTEVGRMGVALNGMLARLERSFAETKASEERLRRFLSDAAHELRTPLVSIRGYAELFRMAGPEDSERVTKALERVEAESVRMGAIVDDLLVLARFNEVPDTERTVVDVSALLEDSAADAEAMDPARAVDIQVDGDAFVLGDNNALRQVLSNLVRNAVVHTPPGTPLEFRSQRDDTSVALSVRDHGHGLPADDPDALFERFWRGEEEENERDGPRGAGLGLSIVAAITRAHGGDVSAANAPGGGAVFTVTLPLCTLPVT